jgi:hypothetical protein
MRRDFDRIIVHVPPAKFSVSMAAWYKINPLSHCLAQSLNCSGQIFKYYAQACLEQNKPCDFTLNKFKLGKLFWPIHVE